MHRNISKIILDCCKKEGIKYCSLYYHVDEAKLADAIRLGELYLELKEIAGEIWEIAEKHELDGLKELLQNDIKKLDDAEHDILKIAHKMKGL